VKSCIDPDTPFLSFIPRWRPCTVLFLNPLTLVLATSTAHQIWCKLVDTPFCAFAEMSVDAILNFHKVLLWTTGNTCIAMSISIPYWVQIGRELAEICSFVYFPRWRPPPSWISKSAILCLIILALSMSISTPNVVQNYQKLAKIYPFCFFFQDGNRRQKCYFGPPVSISIPNLMQIGQ